MGGQRDTKAKTDASRRAAGEAARAAVRIAARQHSVIIRDQLRELGFTAREIERRLESGRLRRLYRGVYLLGPTLPPHAHEMAAVLVCGHGAVLSHRSAAYLLQLLAYPANSHPPEVTVPARNPGRKPGIVVHRVRSFPPGEVTTCERIPVTTPARTLLDLASVAAPRELEQAIAELFARRRTNRPQLLSLVAKHPRHRGASALRAQLEADRTPARTRSRPEERLLRLIRRAKLPHPELNVRLGRWAADFYWRERRPIIEIDGSATHSSPRAFRREKPARRRKPSRSGEAGRAAKRAYWRRT